ncbi:MAG TPA: hypothetical protein VLA05_09560, partial [Coriobacteriia bacterium]|nr:hypothetical protein [Coriobacteriia bacterium]
RSVSRGVGLMAGLFAAALGLAFSSDDLLQGSTTWTDLFGSLIALPLVVGLGVWAHNRWVEFPHVVFGYRMHDRGVLPAGRWEAACTKCGGPSEDMRVRIAETDLLVTWKCRRCGTVNTLGPAHDCSTHA